LVEDECFIFYLSTNKFVELEIVTGKIWRNSGSVAGLIVISHLPSRFLAREWAFLDYRTESNGDFANQ